MEISKNSPEQKDKIHITGTEEVHEKSNNFQAGMNLVKVFVGIGIIMFPQQFQKSGWFLSLLAIIGVAALCNYAMYLLIKVAEKEEKPGMTLLDLCRMTNGDTFEKIARITVLCSQISVAVSYIVFTRDFTKRVMCLANIDSLCSSGLFPLGLAMMFIIPFSLIHNFHYFSYVSIISSVFQLFVFVTLSVVNLKAISSGHVDPSPLKVWDFMGLTASVGNFLFKYEGVPVLIDIRNSMKEPRKLSQVLAVVVIAISFFYFFFPLFAMMVFREKTLNIILFNYPLDQTLFFILSFLYTLVIIFSFPLQFFPVLDILQGFEGLRKCLSETGGGKLRVNLLRIGFVFIFSCAAYFTKKIEVLLEVCGVIFVGPISLLIPIIMYNTYFSKEISSRMRYFNYTIFVLSVILLGLGFWAIVRGDDS